MARSPQASAHTAAAELARAVVVAARGEPGERTAVLSRLLEDAGVDPVEGDQLLASVRESQQLIARLQRRAAELEALFSTARELVTLRDVSDVLRRLVERAHELMGTDVTYLSEVDNERGDLRVRYSAGTVTPEFRDLLVPAGFGLASLVASTREPAWVREYVRMQEAPHDAAIDAAVQREGLVSFLGVPLAVGDEVLGALFACNRFAHDFTPDQVLLLSAFADHAAAVLHSARVLAESAAARTQAEAAYREIERLLAATQAAADIHEELTAAVISGGTVADLVSMVSERLDRRVCAVDDSGQPLDAPADVRRSLPSSRSVAAAIQRSHASGHAERIAEDGRRFLVVAIVGADRVLGAMVAEEGGELPDDVARATLERAAHVAALVSLKREAASALRAERRARILLGVLDAKAVAAASDLVDELSSMPTACAVIDLRGREAALTVTARAVGDDGLAAQRDGHLLIVWAAPDAVAATERVRGLLAASLREPRMTAVTAMVGSPDGRGPDEGVELLRAAVDRATRDLRFLAPLGISGGTVRSEAFAPYHALTSVAPDAAMRYVDDILGGVRDWDARRGTELVETLGAYFDSGESRQGAAAVLHVHTNTVQQRLERVWSLLDGDWADAEYRFRVHAAVRLERLRRSLAEEAAGSMADAVARR